MTKISKAEFETLPESLKAKFTAVGDDYILQEEDVEGLKKSKAEILAEKKRVQDELDELKKFKAEHDAKASEVDEEQKRKAGDFEALEKKLRDRIAEVETTAATEKGALLSTVKRETLKNLLIEKGVLPDRANYALIEMADQFDIASGEQGFSLKLKNGIGEAGEIDTAVAGLKTKAAFLFGAGNTTGGGAEGSSNNNGGGTPKTASRAEIAAMSPEAKRDFYLNDGEPSD